MSPLRNSLILVCLALTSLGAAHAKSHPPKPTPFFAPDSFLSDADRRHILGDHFVTVTRVRDIPKPVLSQFQDEKLGSGMAEPGQPFEESDMVGPIPLPSSRLVFAAISEGYCLVYYEFGGYGNGTGFSVYRLAAGKATRIGQAWPSKWSGFLTLARIQDRIRTADAGHAEARK